MESLVIETARRLQGQRVLVTGAAGFIGRSLTRALVTGGARVACLDTPGSNLATLCAELPNVQSFLVDICDPDATGEAIQHWRPTHVFHLAAAGVTQPFLPLEKALAVNLYGSINLFRACFANKDYRAIRLIHTGTPYEYGHQGPDREPNPINPYAASKAAIFAVARMFQRVEQWPIVTIRPFQVYGPGQAPCALIPAAILAARNNEPFATTKGEQRRDFIFVDDVVRGYLLAACNGIDGHSYDLGWGDTHALREVIGLLFSLIETESRPVFGALPYRPGEIWELAADRMAATKELSWTPQISLQDGLEQTISSY